MNETKKTSTNRWLIRAVFVLMSICVLHACSDDETKSIGGDEGDNNSSANFDKRLSVGCGYNVFDEYAKSEYLKEPILDYNALRAANLIDSVYPNTTKCQVDTGYTCKTLLKNLSKGWGLGVDSNYKKTEKDSTNKTKSVATRAILSFNFSASVNKSYDETTKKTETSRFAFAQFTSEKMQIKVRAPYAYTDKLKPYLTKAASAAINGTNNEYAGDAGIDKLLREYGTHVIVNAYFGGRLDYTLAADQRYFNENKNTSITKTASMGLSFIGISIGGNGNNTVKTHEDSTFIQNITEKRALAIGGNSEYVITTSQDYTKWVDGLSNRDNWNLCRFSTDATAPSLLPIWGFCDDDTRAQAIYNYVNTTWADKYALPDPNYTLGKKVNVNAIRFRDSWVCDVIYQGDTIARACKEFIPDISTDKQFVCIYPYVDGRLDLQKGYVTDDGGQISWDDNGTFNYIEGNGKVDYVLVYGNGNIVKTGDKSDNNATTPERKIVDRRVYAGGKIHEDIYNLTKVGNLFVSRTKFTAAAYLNGTNLPNGSYNDHRQYKKVAFYGKQNLAPSGTHIATYKDWEIIRNNISFKPDPSGSFYIVSRNFVNNAGKAGLNDFWKNADDRFAIGDGYDGCVNMKKNGETILFVPFDSSNDKHYIRIVCDN